MKELSSKPGKEMVYLIHNDSWSGGAFLKFYTRTRKGMETGTFC